MVTEANGAEEDGVETVSQSAKLQVSEYAIVESSAVHGEMEGGLEHEGGEELLLCCGRATE